MYIMSETNERKLEKLQKQLDKLTILMLSLFEKHVDPSLKTMRDEYHQNRMFLEDSIDMANKELSVLTSRRDKLVSDYKKLKNIDIKKIIDNTRERLLKSEKTKNKYTRNLKTLMHKRSQIRYKIYRLTTGKRLEKETDSPTLSVSVSPPRKKSASPTRKKSASPTRKKSSPGRNSKTSKRR